MTSTLVVVLNWNGINDTERCIDSLSKQSYQNYKILVIDNGSIDDSLVRLENIEQSNKKVILIANEKNKGFSGGVNIGIRYAIENNYDTVALFNNDAIADREWLANLVGSIEKTNAAIVTCLLLDSTRRVIDTTGEVYSIWGVPFPNKRGVNASNAPSSGEVFGATGGASLFRTSLFKEIGLFDENFFAYYEDVDISFRTQLTGNKIFFTDQAIAYHKKGATSNKIPGFTVYQTFKNLPLLYIKNVPAALLFPVGIRLLLIYILFFGNAVKNGSGWPATKGWVASIWFFWTNSLWQRFKIQSNKKVSTSYISNIILHDLPPDQTGMRKFRKIFTGKD